MAIVADSGGIFALYDSRDRFHKAVRSALEQTRDRIHLPAPLLGELGYLLDHWLGTSALLRFLADVDAGSFQIEAFLPEDLRRCQELLQRYADLNLGLCDAAVAATAERLGIDRILTVDERHFRVIRTSAGGAFRLLPADRRKQ